jgi:hypothetical protein
MKFAILVLIPTASALKLLLETTKEVGKHCP